MEKAKARTQLRKWSMRVAIILVGFVASTIFGSFITAYGTENGWYDHPSKTVAAVIGFLQSVLQNDWFQIIASLIVGFAVGVRSDNFLKPAPDTGPREETAVELKVRYPHDAIHLLIDAGYRREMQFGAEQYRNKIIDLPLLFGGNFYIKSLVFEDCVLAGPAIVSGEGGSNMFHCAFLAEINSEETFIEITDERAKHLITCGYRFEECTFRRCKFYRVGLIGSRKTLATVRAALGAKK